MEGDELGISLVNNVVFSKLGNPSITKNITAKLAAKETNQLTKGITYKTWEEMRLAHPRAVTKYVKNEKPDYSPIPKKWFDDNGTITVQKVNDQVGTEIWTYTNKAGQSVPYTVKEVNGQLVKTPDFSAYLHPDKRYASVDIGSFTGNRYTDRELYKKLTSLKEVPDGYEVHHDFINGKLQLVEKEIHKKFTHIGGNALNKNN